MGTELTVLPSSRAQIAAIVRRCRALVRRRALVCAGAAMVPVPGLDIATDLGLLPGLITRINGEFGLAPEQIARLPTETKVKLYQTIVGFGATMVGMAITRDMVLRALQIVSTRISLQQASKYLPVAGQAVSAAIGYTAMWYVGERHIKDCIRTVESVAGRGN